MKWNTDGKFTLLGITFELNEKDKTAINYKNALDKVKRLLNTWTLRKLTLKGKITVIKSLALSKIIHLLMV